MNPKHPILTFILASILASCIPAGTTTPPAGDAGAGLGSCTLLDQAVQGYVVCKGAFAAGKAASLCPAGYTLATTMMPTALNNACDGNIEAIANDYFYAVDVGAWANPQNPYATANQACSNPGGWTAALMGCGGKQRSGDMGSTAYTVMLGQRCQGWPHARYCGGPSLDWTCPDGTLKTASNTNPNSGVICFSPNP